MFIYFQMSLSFQVLSGLLTKMTGAEDGLKIINNSQGTE